MFRWLNRHLHREIEGAMRNTRKALADLAAVHAELRVYKDRLKTVESRITYLERCFESKEKNDG